jgi:HAMP domain-containing protein
VRLLAKFNVVLIPLCLLSIWFIGMLSHSFLLEHAREETLERAELMITSASSVREYTEKQLTPLLSHTAASRKRFLPQTIPFYAATVTFDSLRQRYPDYTYKEAALNPTNLRDRANDWETDVITYFRNHDSTAQLVGERDTPTGRSLYLAHPIRTETDCLQCHGSPAKAPATLVAAYGSTDGFGWGPYEVVGAQIVSVPMNVPVQIAKRGYATLMSYLALTFVVIIAVINLGLYLIVIRPLRKIAAVAEQVSRGEQAETPVPRGRDEIADVSLSVHRLSVSLNKALQMLEPNQ